MTEEEVYGQAVELMTQGAGLTDADRWWVIEQVAALCRAHDWLAPSLVEGFEEWVTEEQAEESDWIPVADVLADLSTRWPEPHLALIWCRLAWEREGEVLRCVEEADRLARLDGADEELPAFVDGQCAWLLALEGQSKEALGRAQRCLRDLGPDQGLEALVADLLDVEETAATGATWAAAALQAAHQRGEDPADDLRECWARLHWKWMEQLLGADTGDRRELAGILTELAAHPEWVPDEDSDVYVIGFARLCILCGLHEQALGWLAQASDRPDEPVFQAEAAVVEAEALFGLTRVEELSDLIRQQARTVAQVGDPEQQGRLAVLAHAVARAQLDWEGADRILDGMDPDVLDPDGVEIGSELDRISRRVMGGVMTTAEVDALADLAQRGRELGLRDWEQALLRFAAMVAAASGDVRSGQLRTRAETLAAEADGGAGGQSVGPEFFAMLEEASRLARDTPEAALARVRRFRDLPTTRARHFMLLVVDIACALIEVRMAGQYQAGLDSVEEGLRLCEKVIGIQRSSRERSRLRHLRLTLVELGLVAAEAVGDTRAIAELIEFQRSQSMPVARQVPGVEDLPFERISLLLADRFEEYEPDDADLTLPTVPTKLPWPARFSAAGDGAVLRIPHD